jgi:hypothetical protein
MQRSAFQQGASYLGLQARAGTADSFEKASAAKDSGRSGHCCLSDMIPLADFGYLGRRQAATARGHRAAKCFAAAGVSSAAVPNDVVANFFAS